MNKGKGQKRRRKERNITAGHQGRDRRRQREDNRERTELEDEIIVAFDVAEQLKPSGTYERVNALWHFKLFYFELHSAFR